MVPSETVVNLHSTRAFWGLQLGKIRPFTHIEDNPLH